jgi:hypothetical protein
VYPAVPMGQNFGTTAAPAGFGYNGSLSVMVTALSDKSFVVTEPGLGPKNEVGIYLTVYRVEGDKIREVSRVFHRSAAGGRSLATPAARPGAMTPRASNNSRNFYRDAQQSPQGNLNRGANPTAPVSPGGPFDPDQLQPGTSVTPPSGRPGALIGPFQPLTGPGAPPSTPGSPGQPADPARPQPGPGGPTAPSDVDPRSPYGSTKPADPRTPAGDVLGGGNKPGEDPFDNQ